MSSHRFAKYEDGSMKKVFSIDSDPEHIYRISVPEKDWTNQVSRSISRWIKRFKEGRGDSFRWGKIEKISKEEFFGSDNVMICSFCKRSFRYKSGFSKHKKICKHAKQNQITLRNERISDTPRTFGEENPKWLTSELLYGVLNNLPKAIQIMIRTKHFNDKFPENQNLRIDSKQGLDHRLQVFEEGRWTIKNSKQTFYKVLINICDILSDALEEEEEIKEDADDESDEDEGHIDKEIKRLRTSERFLHKINQIRPLWESIREKIGNADDRVDLWEDLKTLLLDRHLAIQQGFD